MKNYDNLDNFRKRVHTIRVTFQLEDYKGYIAYEMGGNCQGFEVMDFDISTIDQNDINRFVENNCKFKFNEEYELFSLELRDRKGNPCIMESETESDINNMIVAIQIIDCRLENE